MICVSYDVHVVGAGVSGCITARLISSAGLKTIITEEDKKVGLPQHCTGLVSVRGLEESGLSYKEAVLNSIRGSRIIGPGGTEIIVRRQAVQAYVVDRPVLDRIYCEAAEDAGAEVRLGTRIRTRRDYLAKVVVGADGARSTIAEIEGFPGMPGYVQGFQEIIRTNDLSEEDMVSVFLSNTLFPGFFGWLVPIGDCEAIIGYGQRAGVPTRGTMHKLTEMAGIKKYGIKRRIGGIIPLGPRPKTCNGHSLLVGDAGGYTKATSGGGVYFSTLSAKVAAKCILSGRVTQFDSEMVSYKRELYTHLRLRKLYNLSNDIIIEAALRLGKALGLPGYLERKGDMDYASSVFN